jgi:hypothetical protein
MNQSEPSGSKRQWRDRLLVGGTWFSCYLILGFVFFRWTHLFGTSSISDLVFGASIAGLVFGWMRPDFFQILRRIAEEQRARAVARGTIK